MEEGEVEDEWGGYGPWWVRKGRPHSCVMTTAAPPLEPVVVVQASIAMVREEGGGENGWVGCGTRGWCNGRHYYNEGPRLMIIIKLNKEGWTWLTIIIKLEWEDKWYVFFINMIHH